MIIADFPPNNTNVEIQDVFECGGVKLAIVKALAGKPFVDGTKCSVRTEYATVKVADLFNVGISPRRIPR